MLAVSPFWVTAAAIVFAGVWVALCGEAAGQYSNQASAGRLRGLTLALRTAVLEVIPWAASAPTTGVPTTSSEVVCEGSSVTPLLAVTVKLKLPAVVGVPESSPSALRWRPPGRFPPVTVELRAGRLGRGLEGVGVFVADHAAGQLGRRDLRLALPV